jgi:hypothetical protein
MARGGIPSASPRQCGREIPADDRAGQDAKLAAKAADQVPDLPAL